MSSLNLCVEENVEGCGSGLFAVGDLSKTTTVLSTRPEVTILYSDAVLDYCGTCFLALDTEDSKSHFVPFFLP